MDKTSIRRAACAAVLLLGASPLLCAAAPQVFSSAFFGAHVLRSVPNPLWKQAGFGALRLHDTNVTWADLEPEQGRWNWNHLDRIVANAKGTGAELLLPLQGTPDWAASDPASVGAYGKGANTAPARMSDWIDYVRAVATRYKGVISAYEVWNEPNLTRFFNGSPRQMAVLTRNAAQAIRQVDPAARIVCSGITGNYGLTWFKDYLAAGADKYCDIIAYHFYVQHGAPEKMAPLIADVKKTLAGAGIAERALWNTETGWVIDTGGGARAAADGVPTTWKALPMETALAYIPRALLIARSNGVQRFYWYAWDHGSMGLTAGRGVKLTPAARLYTNFRNYVIGGQVDACKPAGTIWNCKLALRDGTAVDVFWSTAGTESVQAARAGTLREIDASGDIRRSRSLAADAEVEVGPKPVFIEYGARP